MGGKVKNYDLIVIGSGAGGGVGANYAVGLGKKVALFEKGEFGGECPNIGCVPTKAILQAVDAYETARSSEYLGIKAKPSFSWKDVLAWKDTAVDNTGTKQGKQIFENNGIDVYQQKANFISPKQIEADGQIFQAKRFLVATGAKTFIPPIPGLESSGYITSTEALKLEKVPESIVIIGGGAIGCEYAEMFNAFGSRVHIVETLPKLLCREDNEVSDLVKAIFESKGINVAVDARVEAVNGHSDHKVVHLQKNGRNHRISTQHVLIATGKAAVTDFGLDKAKVKFNRKRIEANSFLQTTNPRVYAAGDIAGPYQFTHTAEYQSQVAVYNAFHRRNRHRVDYKAIPRCTFINPEVASVGASEQQLKDQGIAYKTGAVPLSLIGRSNTSGQDTGFTKVIAHRKDNRLLGGSVVGPRSGEVINELALAIHMGAKVNDLASTVHAFPTFSEALMYAARAVK